MLKKTNYIIYFFLITFGLSLFSCGDKEKGPDVSDIKVSLETRRLDLDIAALDTNNMEQGVSALLKKYPDFLDFYVVNLLPFAITSDSLGKEHQLAMSVMPFLTEPDFKGLMDSVKKHFPDTKSIDADITKGMKYMKYYYPDYKVPQVVYFVTGLNSWSAITFDNILGIGLDMYLGKEYPYYLSVGIPEYATPRFRPEYAVVNSFKAIYEDKHPFVAEGRHLLDMMIQRGKEQYFLEKILPFIPDTLRIGFTEKQLKWCEGNEGLAYNFLVRENLIYETNWQKVLRYVNDAPSSTGMPAESPGNIGSWLGLRIVKAYAEKHPELKMEQIFAMINAQQILQESEYKPRK